MADRLTGISDPNPPLIGAAVNYGTPEDRSKNPPAGTSAQTTSANATPTPDPTQWITPPGGAPASAPTAPQSQVPATPTPTPSEPTAAQALAQQNNGNALPAASWDVGMDETVSGQLKKLISEDSPVLQQAKANAQRYAAARGMQNSTLAAQAGEQALISTATPIAQADAGVYHDVAQGIRSANLSTDSQKQLIQTQASANSLLQAQQADEQLQYLMTQGSINERLQTIDQNFKSLQADLDRGMQITLEDQRFQNNQALMISEYAQRSGLSAQEAQQEINRLNQAHLNTLEEIAATARSKGADYSAALQGQYLTEVSNIMQATTAAMNGVYSSGSKPDVQKQAIDKLLYEQRMNLNSLQSYYQSSPAWDPEWGNQYSLIGGV
jgi:hypothetical protein